MHIREERKLLLAFSLVFAVLAFALFGYGLTTKAAENTLTTTESKYFVEYRATKTADDGSKTWVYSGTINSSMQVIAWFQDVDYQLYQGLVDAENKKLYLIRDTAITNCCRWVNAKTDVTDNEKGTTNTTVDLNVADNTENKLTQGHFTLMFKNGTYEYSGMIFDSYENAENYATTGSTTGMIKGDDNPSQRDFGEEFDPTVPIPELTNLSYNGFTLNNPSEDMEIDLVIKSEFDGLLHGDSNIIIQSPAPKYVRNLADTQNCHYYDCTQYADIGYTTKTKFVISEDFDCPLLADLLEDGANYFKKYPYHNNLSDYSFLKHGGTNWTTAYDILSAGYLSNPQESALYASEQAEVKYYVRFLKYDYQDVGATLIPGQWYCYTFCSNGSSKDSIGISPVTGDPDGNPIETNPTWGDQDPITGDPNYNIGDLPSINTANPLEMLKGFLELVTSLPDMVGEFNLFLSDTFCFIPEKYWTLILAGVGFSVLFLVFSWFRG